MKAQYGQLSMIPYYSKSCFETPIRDSRVEQLCKAIESLQSKYDLVIRRTLDQLPGGSNLASGYIREKLDAWFDTENLSRNLMLEILTPKESSDLFFFIQVSDIDHLQTTFGKRYHDKGLGFISTFTFSSGKDVSAAVAKFHNDFGNALKSKFRLKNPPKLSKISIINKTVEDLEKKRHTTDSIPASIVSSLNLLKDADFRSIVSRAKQAKDPTLHNIVASAGISEADAEPLFNKAVDEKILIRQYNVICCSCGAALARVPTKTAIAQMSKDQVACPKCKTCVKANSHEDCYVVADQISRILNGSKWLDLFVRHKMEQYPQVGRILTEVVDGPNELDVIANLDGKLLFAELKDARFDIGHAYPFVGKCSQYEPDIAIIIATQGVSDDVKEYIQNTGLEPHYIESLEFFDQEIESVFSEENVQKMGRLVGETEWTSLVSQTLLSALGASLPIPEEGYSYGFTSSSRYIRRGRFRRT